MLEWLKKHSTIITTVSVTVVLLLYIYGCEPTTQSLTSTDRQVNRAELQYELTNIIDLAELRMLDLDKQDQLRAVILQNALIIVQGQPFNPVGLITAFAAVYGLMQGGSNVKQVVKTQLEKRKVKNG